MRNSWRLLLSRSYLRLTPQFTKSNLASHQRFEVHSPSPTLPFHAFSCAPSNPLEFFLPAISRGFSSEPETSKDTHLVISEAFTNFTDLNVISRELEANSVVLSHEVVLKALKALDSNPEAARRFFDWVSEKDGGKLSSKVYNLMLGIMGSNGLVEDFWGLVDVVKKKGFCVSGVTRDRAMERFEKDGLVSDVERLKGLFATGSVDSSVEKVGLRVSRIVRNRVWGEDVEGEIKGLVVVFSGDLVKIVLENLVMEPMKAVIFFRWVEETVKHDGVGYNAMARVLGREDCLDRFWKIVDEMRRNGFDMEVDTYFKVLGRFLKRKMMKEAVDLCEFAMAGANKPSVQCCTFLLKKIASAKELDMDLFSRVVKIFVGNGCVLTDSMLNAVLKSLTSVGRFEECNKILREMKKGGLIPGSNVQTKIALGLSCKGKKDEATEFVNDIEASGGKLDDNTWASLVEGFCISGDLEKASECFQTMIVKVQPSNSACYAFDSLVNSYCSKNRAMDSYKLLQDCVSENQFKPWQKTYKVLIKKLLVQGGFSEALTLLDTMKKHGYPPCVGPFVEYVSKTGTDNDAIAFMKAMTSKKFPSTSVVLRVFRAFFQAGRFGEAQDLLSKCPGHVRNEADVLNLFHKMQRKNDDAQASAA